MLYLIKMSVDGEGNGPVTEADAHHHVWQIWDEDYLTVCEVYDERTAREIYDWLVTKEQKK